MSDNSDAMDLARVAEVKMGVRIGQGAEVIPASLSSLTLLLALLRDFLLRQRTNSKTRTTAEAIDPATLPAITAGVVVREEPVLVDLATDL